MPTKIKDPPTSLETSLKSKRLELEHAEQILEQWETSHEQPKPEAMALLFALFPTEERLDAERRRVHNKLACIRDAGTPAEYERCKRDLDAAIKAADTRVPELERKISGLQSEARELLATRRRLEGDVERMANARRRLPQYAPPALRAPGSSWDAQRRALSDTIERDVAATEARLATISGALRLTCTDIGAVRHCQAVHLSGGRAPQIHIASGRIKKETLLEAEWLKYQDQLRSEAAELHDRLAKLTAKRDAELERLNADLLAAV